jgi:hypothetical protein
MTWTGPSGLTAMAFAGLLVMAPQASAQDPPAQEEKPAPGTPPESGEEAGDPQEGGDETDLRDLNPFTPPTSGETDLEDLFRIVEKRLKRVTSLLYEASSGDATGADGIGGAGIDELIRGAEKEAAGASSGIARMLQATRGQSQATLQDIQRILEIAEQQSRAGGQPPPTPSQGMPQQGQTPSGSRKEDKGERPPEGGEPDKPGEKPEGEEPKNGDEPKGDQEAEGGPDGPAKPPAEGATGDPAAAAGLEDWGDLPVHLRQVFQNGVSEDVPPRYRDWVDSYYKRLNRRSKKR